MTRTSGLLLVCSIWAIVQEPEMAAEIPSREPEAQFVRANGHVIDDILFTPDGRHLVGIGEDKATGTGIIDFWDMQTKRTALTVTQPGRLSSAAFTPDGKRLITSGWDKKMRIFAGPNWAVEQTFDHDPANQTANYLAMLADGTRAVSANVGLQGPRIWDLTKRTAAALPGQNEQGAGVAASRDGKRVAVAYSAPVTEILSVDTLQVVGQLRLAKGERYQGVFVSVAFSPDGRWIATGSLGTPTDPRQMAIIMWDSKTLRKHRECGGLSDFPYALHFTKDSRLLVSCMGAEQDVAARLCVWDVETGSLVYAFSPWKHGCLHQAFSPDDRWLVTCGVDCTLRLWDFARIRSEIGK